MLRCALVLAILFVALDGAADSLNSGHLHAADIVEHLDAAHVDDDHCERCCHGHVSWMITFASLHLQSQPSDDTHTRWVASLTNTAQAPPTPPPNS